MNLEDQVCSFELSKHLKELGIKQESLFWWINDGADLEFMDFRIVNKKVCFSAFAVAEIGEILPPSTYPLTYWIMKIRSDNKDHRWQGDIVLNNKSLMIFNSEHEADIRAKMLIYLIENKLIELPE